MKERGELQTPVALSQKKDPVTHQTCDFDTLAHANHKHLPIIKVGGYKMEVQGSISGRGARSPRLD